MNETATTVSASVGSIEGVARPRFDPWALLRRLTTDRDLQRSVLALVDQALVSGTNFATSVVIGRWSKPELGVYYLALSVWLLVRGVQEQVVCAPYMIYAPRKDRDELARYTGSTLAHNAFLTLFALLGLTGLAVAIGFGIGPTSLGGTAWVLLAAVPCLLLREYARHYAFSHLRMPLAIGIDAVVCGVQLAGLGLLFATGTLTVPAVYGVIALACCLASMGWLVAIGQPIRFEWPAVKTDWIANWVFARWALACHLFAHSATLILPWVLALVSGDDATGSLAACMTIIGLANVFVMGLANYLSPKAAHAYGNGGVSELQTVLKKTLLLFVATLGTFAVGSIFVGDLLVTFVYGDGYEGAGVIVAVLAFGMLGNGIGITAGNGLWAMEKPSANFRADVASFVAAVVATIVFVPWLGVLGAALASLAGQSVDAVARSVICLRLLAEKRREIA